MGRTSINLTDDQERLVAARARAEGVSKAEVIRRLLDTSLAQVSRTRREEARGSTRPLSEIDDWPSWLTKLR